MERLKKMELPITGSCLCGQFAYQCSSTPVWSVNCHCKACQKSSGAPYVSAFSVPKNSFEITMGDTVTFSRKAENGNNVSTFLCVNCGTRLFAKSEGNQNLINIFAPTLDDATHYVAVSNVFLSEAAHWIEPDEKRFNFEKMPKF